MRVYTPYAIKPSKALYIKTARGAAHLTVKELAELIDVSPRTVQNWEQGRNEPDEQTMSAIYKATGAISGALPYLDKLRAENPGKWGKPK